MRIGIVNDMVIAVEAMRRIVSGAHEHQVAWIARDGQEAVERCAGDTPDLILMDLIMPKMDGVEATRHIMASTPCAIVVVTADVGKTTSKVFDALGAGALDAVNTPKVVSLDSSDGAKALLAKIDTIRKLIGGANGSSRSGIPGPAQASKTGASGPLVVIGASAGGPAALANVLGALPEDFPAPIVIVQHVDPQFAPGLSDWLNQQSGLQVRLARDGDRPRPGTVLLANGDNHLVFTSTTRLGYRPEPIDCSYRPSVDVFFKSAGLLWPGNMIGVILTGMGKDGAQGLLSLRARGCTTIAQDEATCVVYGMPKAAAQLAAASEILPLQKIGPRLTAILTQRRKEE
jgi:two-component system response regulator WspF